MRTGAAELATAPDAGGPKVMPNGVSPYAVVLPDDVKAFPEYLRKAGYYTTNNQKTDHQFEPPVTVWDDNGSEASYRNYPKGKPFFSVFNFFLTQDSQVAMRQDLLLADPAKVTVPPIYPDTPGGRAVADDAQ